MLQNHLFTNIKCVYPLKGHTELDNLRRSYYSYLMETNQNEKAAEVRENEGDFTGAVNLYLKAGLPAKAAWLAMSRDELLSSHDIISRITAALIKGEFYERVSLTCNNGMWLDKMVTVKFHTFITFKWVAQPLTLTWYCFTDLKGIFFTPNYP